MCNVLIGPFIHVIALLGGERTPIFDFDIFRLFVSLQHLGRSRSQSSGTWKACRTSKVNGTMRSFIDGVDVWNSMHSIRVERSSRLALAKAQVVNNI